MEINDLPQSAPWLRCRPQGAGPYWRYAKQAAVLIGIGSGVVAPPGRPIKVRMVCQITSSSSKRYGTSENTNQKHSWEGVGIPALFQEQDMGV